MHDMFQNFISWFDSELFQKIHIKAQTNILETHKDTVIWLAIFGKFVIRKTLLKFNSLSISLFFLNFLNWLDFLCKFFLYSWLINYEIKICYLSCAQLKIISYKWIYLIKYSSFIYRILFLLFKFSESRIKFDRKLCIR